jgi:hypothetical protein
MLTFPQAMQTISALEARRLDFEARLAAGTVYADDAEMVIRECSAALAAIRDEMLPEQADPITAAKAAQERRDFAATWPTVGYSEAELRALFGDR